jgi:hypothetical protein
MFRLRTDDDPDPMRVHFRLVDAVEGEPPGCRQSHAHRDETAMNGTQVSHDIEILWG